MSYQQCKRCVMDNQSDTTIRFDNDGYCNYCTDVLRRLPTEYFPNEKGKAKLDAIVAEMKEKAKDDPYDCIIGLSGGIDSSYIAYLGYQYGLRMLGVHIDDGTDNPIATENLKKLVDRTGIDMKIIRPDLEEYADVLKALFRASVPNLALAQDNLIVNALQQFGEENKIRYSLDGNNMAHESILQRDAHDVNMCDKKNILSIHKRFGDLRPGKLQYASLVDRYIRRRYFSHLTHIRPLNYIPYNLNDAICQLHEFCGFEYYGGKHYESILTRFLQCYYLPVKFQADKRKSHYSSLIVVGQMTREEALEKLKTPCYSSDEMLNADKEFLATYMGISIEELDSYIALPPKNHMDYPHSYLNELAPLARKLRKYIE